MGLDTQILHKALKAWGKHSRNVSCCYPAGSDLPPGHYQQQPPGAILLSQQQSLSAFLFFLFCGSWFAFSPQTGGPPVLIPQAVPGRWRRGLQAVAVGSSPHSHSPILSCTGGHSIFEVTGRKDRLRRDTAHWQRHTPRRRVRRGLLGSSQPASHSITYQTWFQRMNRDERWTR